MNIKRISIFVFVLLILLVALYLIFFNRGHKNLHKSYDLFIKDKEVYLSRRIDLGYEDLTNQEQRLIDEIILEVQRSLDYLMSYRAWQWHS